jgi:hypothetical protein
LYTWLYNLVHGFGNRHIAAIYGTNPSIICKYVQIIVNIVNKCSNVSNI